MGLAIRIIPCLDVDRGRVVKGTKFLDLKDAGDPVAVAQRYNSEGADEITFLDITASSENRPILLEVVRKTAEQVFIPLTVGGGVRAVQDVRTLLRAGADKVSINTAAIERPRLIQEGADSFGAQCMVVAIDCKRREGTLGRTRWEVYSHGGRKPAGLDAVEWAERAEKLGAGEILLTSMDADGTQAGYDLSLLKQISDAVGIPVIASGGAGEKKHFYEAWKSGASACLAASLFHYRQLDIQDLKRYLKRRKMPVRI
ncbi:MAG: imidazole glycerol phosphate synthase subunit HisF [Elusimicrobia bacterium]|nr:imidazole glycerol phosphate synthase subunit HisF [Elusimicrobiota bacterium]MBI4217493.1 imidazole glycerol phosphate synthase subunit HisF [Elusimicrobiota bacterium]